MINQTTHLRTYDFTFFSIFKSQCRFLYQGMLVVRLCYLRFWIVSLGSWSLAIVRIVSRRLGDLFVATRIILFKGNLLYVTLSLQGQINTSFFNESCIFEGRWATGKGNLGVVVNGWILFVHNKVNNKKNNYLVLINQIQIMLNPVDKLVGFFQRPIATASYFYLFQGLQSKRGRHYFWFYILTETEGVSENRLLILIAFYLALEGILLGYVSSFQEMLIQELFLDLGFYIDLLIRSNQSSILSLKEVCLTDMMLVSYLM